LERLPQRQAQKTSLTPLRKKLILFLSERVVMNNAGWFTEQEFQSLTKIVPFEDLPPEDISAYTDILLDYLCLQLESDKVSSVFWCPKCETYGAVLEVDEQKERGIASCGHCKMAIVVFYGENESNKDPLA